MEFKVIVSFLTVLLTFVGYVPYVIDILRGKTKPHVYTWLGATVTAFTAYGLQVLGGAGVGAWPMLVISLICVLVLVLSFWKGTDNRTAFDLLCIVLSFIALFLWLVVQQPILSVLLITFAEILAFVPTVRKSWHQPYSETLSLYSVSAVRHSLSILALEKLNILTALYPAAWALTNVVIVGVLILRRRAV